MLRRRIQREVAVVLILCDLAFSFQQTAIVPAVKDVRQAFGSPREWSAWLVTVYLVVAVVATPAFGRLGDRYGRRRMLSIGLGVFLVGCLGAAAAPNMAVLLLWRAVQGVGGSVYPLTLALGREKLPQGQFRGAVALFAGAFGAGTALGFVCGGALAQYASWRLIFVCGAALVLAALVAVRSVLPERGPRTEGEFDWPGTALLSVAVVAVLVALTLVARHGWTSPAVLTLLVVSVVVTAWWVRVELGHHDPVVDVRAESTGGALRANTSSFALGWALFSSYLLLPQFARATHSSTGYGFAVKAWGVGLLLVPLALGQTTGSVAAVAVARRIGRRVTPVAAQSLVAVGFVILAAASHEFTGFLAGTALLGLGVGLAFQSSSAVATSAVEPDEAAASSADVSAVRRLGGGIGGQVCMLVLASASVGATTHPAAWTFTVSFAVAAGVCLLGAAALDRERRLARR